MALAFLAAAGCDTPCDCVGTSALVDSGSAVCHAGEVSCEGTTLRRCNGRGDGYVVDGDCASSDVCESAAAGGRDECDICVPGTIRCAEEGGATRFQCDAGGRSETSTGLACSGSTPVCWSGNCVACHPEMGSTSPQTRCDPSDPGRYLQTCTESGAWAQSDCFALNSPDGLTCGALSDDGFGCIGACAAGRLRCSPAGNSQECDAEGEWRLNQTCTPYDLICEPAVGLCDDNPVSDLPPPNGDSLWEAFSNDLLATPFRPDHDIVVHRVGVRTTSSSSGGGAVLGIYRSAVGSDGNEYPDTLVANSVTESFIVVSNSFNAYEPAVDNIVLQAGVTYWLAVKVTSSPLGTMHVRASEPGGQTRFVAAWNGWNSGVFPSTFPSRQEVLEVAGAQLNLFVRSQRVWSGSE